MTEDNQNVYLSHRLMVSLNQEPEVNLSHTSSGLATPMHVPQSPFRPPSASSDLSQSTRTRSMHADKIRRFRRYLEFINVNAVRAGGEDSDDADEFYNDELFSKRHETRYVQRPFAFGPKEDIEIEEGAKMAYDIYDVHRAQKLKILVQDEGHTIQPALRYDDALEMTKMDKILLRDITTVRYKNNICECYGRFMFLGCMSKILILKDEAAVEYLDTKPSFTTGVHREASTWPYFPHTINQIRVTKFEGRDVLNVCIDDGRYRMYDLTNVETGIDLPLIMELTMTSSVWGVDTRGSFVALSDNSQKVTLFHFSDEGVRFGDSLQLIHNIPDLEIVKVGSKTVHLVCTAISGELVILVFNTTLQTLEPCYYSSTSPLKLSLRELLSQTSPPARFSSKIEHRTQLEEPGWTVNYVNSSSFMEVNDPSYLGGRDKISTLDILQRSRILGLMPNHLVSSDLGGAAWYEAIHLKTHYDDEPRIMNRLNSFTDKCARIKKSYFNVDEAENGDFGLTDFQNDFIVVTTASKVGLYRAHRLICNADTGDMFEFGLIEELEFSNRMSIVKVVPELSAVITVSQAGYFTVFRLVKHRGLHSLREEYVFPSNFHDESFDISMDAILGLGVRKVDDQTFWLYFAYTDGSISKFELKENDYTGLDFALL
ncbi:CYFA0S03e01222g1_1 [Cyberlindnera fabianii]|uniref:CYFA0S03e01222g1_1 n=2 Tax=Cyberlindnera fabianii TaxID=36022 RepID=A0A061ANW0_CYBFA|nr:CYFA0S03e01222g1_1 [Cyberlindnera fabianii]